MGSYADAVEVLPRLAEWLVRLGFRMAGVLGVRIRCGWGERGLGLGETWFRGCRVALLPGVPTREVGERGSPLAGGSDRRGVYEAVQLCGERGWRGLLRMLRIGRIEVRRCE